MKSGFRHKVRVMGLRPWDKEECIRSFGKLSRNRSSSSPKHNINNYDPVSLEKEFMSDRDRLYVPHVDTFGNKFEL